MDPPADAKSRNQDQQQQQTVGHMVSNHAFPHHLTSSNAARTGLRISELLEEGRPMTPQPLERTTYPPISPHIPELPLQPTELEQGSDQDSEGVLTEHAHLPIMGREAICGVCNEILNHRHYGKTLNTSQKYMPSSRTSRTFSVRSKRAIYPHNNSNNKRSQ